MLRLDVAPVLLDGGALLAPDHRDPRVAWVVPTTLSVATTASGVPDFTLVRQAGAYGSGGSLTVALTPTMPDLGAAGAGREARLVPMRSLSARLRLDGEGGTQLLAWRDARVAASGEVSLSASFSPRELDAISPLLDLAPPPITVGAVFTYAGLSAGLPLVATVKLATLVDRLRAALPSEPIPASVFIATGVSLLALDPSLVSTTPTDDRAAPPNSSALFLEVIARLLPSLTTSTSGMSPDAPAMVTLTATSPADRLDVNLASPRASERTGTASWSIGDFLAGLDAAGKARALPSITNPDVLSRISVQVMTSAPFDPRFLARLDVGLRFRDVDGKIQQPSCTLAAGATTASIEMVRNVLSPLTIERRITAVIDPEGSPRVVQQPYAPAGPVVDLDADALGLRFVVASADTDVFSSAGAILLSFRATADLDATAASLLDVTLDATTPAGAIAIPGVTSGQPLWVRITASPPSGASGAPVVIGDRAVDGRVDIAGADLIPQGPIDVSIERAAGAPIDRYPTMTVTVRAPGNPETLLRLSGAPRTFKLYPASPFVAPSFDYQVEWIDTTQGFDPIAGVFHSTATSHLVIDPQTEPRS